MISKRHIIMIFLLMTVMVFSSFSLPVYAADGTLPGEQTDESELKIECAASFLDIEKKAVANVTISADKQFKIDECRLDIGDIEYTRDKTGRTIRRNEQGEVIHTEYRYCFYWTDDVPGRPITLIITHGGKTETHDFILKCRPVQEGSLEGEVSAVEYYGKTVRYSGKAVKPDVTIKVLGKVLTKGIDYEFVNNTISDVDVGDHVHKIRFIGNYEGEALYIQKILPKSTALGKITSAGKGKIKVSWKKQALKMSKKRITGYQIRYSTTKAFKPGTYKTITVKGYSSTARTIKNLKSGKTYYLKIRTFRRFSDPYWAYADCEYYDRFSYWSAVRFVKVK